MLDSGSSISTISPETVRKLGLTTQANTLPSTIRNADGTKTKGGWKRNVLAWVDTGASRGKMKIAVVATHNDKFLLGNDWIQKHKPSIDWTTGKVRTRFGTTQLLGTKYIRQALAIRRPRRRKKLAKLGQEWWKQDASKTCIDTDSDSESEDEYDVFIQGSSVLTLLESNSKDDTLERKQGKKREVIPAEYDLAVAEKTPQPKAISDRKEQDSGEAFNMQELNTQLAEVQRQQIARDPKYGAPKKRKAQKEKHSPRVSPYGSAKISRTASLQQHQETSKEDEEPTIGRRIVQIQTKLIRRNQEIRGFGKQGDQWKKVKEDHVTRRLSATGKKVKEYPKINVSKTEQLRKKLTKISSVAQKYSQEKAAAQGRGADGSTKNFQESLPPEIRDYADRFSEEKAKRLPQSSEWDMTIDFEEGKPLPGRQPIYPLSPQEQQAVEEFLEENLEKGWIRRARKGEDVIASPVFFVGKKDGGARMVIDYRGVNKLCKPDPFPIPIMHTLPDELKRAKYFTTLDMRAGYNNLRIRPGDEAKAGFRTHTGVFIPRVMQFGMMNSPAVFQRAMNQLFEDLNHQGVLIYLDDIIIYAETRERLWELTRVVLERLRKADFYLKPEKCFFNLTELDYLGFVVSREGLKMDPYKVKAVQEWPDLKTKRDVRKFIGFANFYRKFINGYSEIVRPLTILLSKKRTFTWGEAQQGAMLKLKEAFSKAPVLVRPDYEKQFIMETDASLVAMGAVLSQKQEDGTVRPIAFWSGTFNSAERNYGVGDRELLAIVKGFEVWRHHLEGAKHPVQVISDHANLATFMEKKKVNRRQARWATELGNFRFTITHKPGKSNGRADALSRRPDYEGCDEDNRDTILLPEAIFDPVINVRHLGLTAMGDRTIDQIIEKNHLIEWEEGYDVHPSGVTKRGNQIVIPPDEELKAMIAQANHSVPLAGHPGPEKTIELIKRRFYWPKMDEWIKEYVQSCNECQQHKARRGKTQPPLEPLAIPEGPWEHITMDFITGLPEVESGENAILTVVDKFSKMAIFIPCKDTTDSKETANLLIKYVYSKHGIPKRVTTDRGPQFASKFTKHVYEMLGITPAMSTAYHPQTDGQSERMNQELEQYLRFYVNERQDDWIEYLPTAEFAHNNRIHASTRHSPFKILYGRDPKMDLLPEPSLSEAANGYVDEIKTSQENAEKMMQKARQQMKEYSDKH